MALKVVSWEVDVEEEVVRMVIGFVISGSPQE